MTGLAFPVVSTVAYKDLATCQQMIARLRPIFEPTICLTPTYARGAWFIRYTERP